jgi:hypothetical protein
MHVFPNEALIIGAAEIRAKVPELLDIQGPGFYSFSSLEIGECRIPQ